ncbi:MAG: hypothetical protein HQK79_00325 [Desulfobacterales bacterium]|nr:hypothetical protein [Desulfobacterales bacterium]
MIFPSSFKLRSINISYLQEISNVLCDMRKALEEINVPPLMRAVNLLKKFIHQVISGEIDYRTGMSYFINLYEDIEGAINDLYKNKINLNFIDEIVKKMKCMIEGC